MREDQLFAPKVQRLLRKKEKEKAFALAHAAEEFESQAALPGKTTGTKRSKNPKALAEEIPTHFGYGRKNPNVTKKYYAKKQTK